MQKLFDFFKENDHFARKCGIVLVEMEAGRAKAEMKIQPFHLNGAKVVHGGAIFTLADFVFAVAVNSRGKLALAINASVSFVNPATEGTLIAEAREISVNRKLANYEVTVKNEKGLLISQFQGTAYRKNGPPLQS